MSKHHTQRSRKDQIDKVEQMIISNGGMQEINQGQGLRLFTYYVAREMACTFSKAKEYIDICVNSAIARKRFSNAKNQDS